jgi:branched-subunit amino acid transport protein
VIGREWVMILGMTTVTFGIRYFLFALADRIKMPSWLEPSLQYIPPAVLISITLPAVLLPKGEWFVSLRNPYLLAALVAAGAGLVRKNLLVTIVAGLAAFFGFQALF